eukprot:jgi/Bigna1/85827/estExt_fgenesh1_pg.C_60208
MSRRGSHHSEQLRSRMLLLFLGTSVLLLCTATGKHRQSLKASPEISTDRFNNTSNGTTAHPTAVEKVPLARLKAPVVIFGAELRIGTLIAIGLAERGERVVAMSRESEPTPDNMILKLAYGMQIIHGVDLKNPKTFERHFKRARAVIFASQARSVFDQDSEVVRFLNGDTPKMVEYKGVKSVVHAAVSAGVPRIVLLSMYMATRTTSVEYKWLNKFKKPSYYTVIRAGGATGEKGFGMQNVTLRQGDYIRGSLPMEDLASVTVASLYTKETRDTVFEVSANCVMDMMAAVRNVLQRIYIWLDVLKNGTQNHNRSAAMSIIWT